MKNIILFTIAFLSIGFIHAQEKKIKFSAYTTWDYSNIPESNLIDHRGKFAVGGGLQGSYGFSEKLELILGLAYIDKGYNEKTIGFGPTDGLVTGISHWWFAYFSVPVKIQYNFKNGKWKWYAAGGIENDFNFDGNGFYIYKDFAQSAVFNLGVSRLISERFRIGLEPTYRAAIQTYGTQNGGNRPDLDPYSFGLKLILTKVK